MRFGSLCLSKTVVGTASFVLLAACSAPGPHQTAEAAPNGNAGTKAAVVGKWGFDLAGMDPAVKPGDDFNRYASGAWIRQTKIPADRTQWGPMASLAAKAEEDVNNIILGLTRKQNPPGSNEQKIADFYTSFVDTRTINELGMKPFEADLAEIAALKTHEQVAAFVARPGSSGNSPIFVVPTIDSKNPDRYVAIVVQAGLGLPNRDYYLNKAPQFAAIRGKYKEYIGQALTLAHIPDAGPSASAVFELETKIAERQWPLEKQRDRLLTYNARNKAQLLAEFPDFPWNSMLASGSLDKQDTFIVAEIGAIGPLSKLFRATPVSVWRSYVTFHYLSSLSAIMPDAFDKANFEFFGKVLGGLPEQRERWKRAIDVESSPRGDATLGEAIGELYARQYFSPEARAQITTLVHNLLDAYQKRIMNSDWMTPETRSVAIRKAQKVRVKVGYPNKVRDYSALVIKPKDPYGNRVRCAQFDWNRLLARLNSKTDRDEWGMGPQAVNAYYNAAFNEIVFPAAILQPPVFDPHADPAINYGGIGGVIGHEMGHGYDDQGAKSDENGILRSWWKKEDEDRFATKAKALAAQFSAYSPLPGLHINGTFTSGENMGDLGGLSVAHEAYNIFLNGRPAPVLDGFTGEQRFFLGWAQVWRSVQRDEYLRMTVTSDFHSPPEYRVNGIVPNIKSWYDAFNVKPGDTLYRTPEDRVRIW